MAESAGDDLRRTAHAWDEAMVGNDAETIGRYMADDWTIIGSDGAITGKTDFLAQIQSGALTHDEMSSADVVIRVYGDSAVLTSSGVSGGQFKGRAFREAERSSNFFVRQDGEWKCVHTHLSRLPDSEQR